MTETVRLVEVGPRDGLQNEPNRVPTAVKLELIRRLVQAGVTEERVTVMGNIKYDLSPEPSLQAQLDAADSAVAEAQAMAIRELRHVEELGRLQARLAQAEVEAAVG